MANENQTLGMLTLDDLRPNDGAKRKRKIVGRGRASGHGKTSTRGHNGQGQRSGEGRRFGFEGGQTPLFRRLPKLHNFDANPARRKWVEVNVGQLSVFSANAEVTPDTLVDNGVVRKVTSSLRILGNGDLKVALKVRAHHVSAGARTKIEAAGGSVEIIPVGVKADATGNADNARIKALKKSKTGKAAK